MSEKTNHHVSTSISGLLRLSNSQLSKLFDRHGPSIRRELMQRLANGEKLIGAEGCEGFDPVTGCPGHPIEETQTPQK